MVLATLYKFGYELTVIETTRAKAETALMAEYEKTYFDINGINPKDDYIYFKECSYYDNAKADIEYRTLKKGVVEWF